MKTKEPINELGASVPPILAPSVEQPGARPASPDLLSPSPVPSRSLADIMAIPMPQETTATRDFLFHEPDAGSPYWEQIWRVTIRTDARRRAEVLYMLLQELATAPDRAKEGYVILTPQGERFVLQSAGLIANLSILSQVVVDPPLKFDEWAMLAHRVGAEQMDALFDWAAAENGVLDYLIGKQREAAKKNGNGTT